MARTVKIVNPNNDAAIFANKTVTVEGARGANPITGLPETLVRVTPSMRPGLDHDLATYPTAWLRDA